MSTRWALVAYCSESHNVNFSFIHSCSADEGFDGTYPTNVVVRSNGSCLYVPPGIFKSTCKIDITWFPFDDQRWYVVKCGIFTTSTFEWHWMWFSLDCQFHVSKNICLLPSFSLRFASIAFYRSVCLRCHWKWKCRFVEWTWIYTVKWWVYDFESDLLTSCHRNDTHWDKVGQHQTEWITFWHSFSSLVSTEIW